MESVLSILKEIISIYLEIIKITQIISTNIY